MERNEREQCLTFRLLLEATAGLSFPLLQPIHAFADAGPQEV